MHFLYLLLSLCLKTYNVIVENSSELLSIEKASLLSLITHEDGRIKKTKVGYTMELSPSSYENIKKHPQVKYIEEDKEIHLAVDNKSTSLSFVLQSQATWGLSKITGYNTKYEYLKNAGLGVDVYIVDSGIDVSHPEFGGRALFRYNGVPNTPDIDENGHGTHCAGIIGSETYGVAKKAKLHAIKIFDKQGHASISRLIEAIDFIISDITDINIDHDKHNMFNFIDIKNSLKRHKRKTVVNMSLGGEKSQALNYMIRYASVHHKIHFSSAAGNENSDACIFSPSSSSALTIGASDAFNFIASFSNEGKCVDLYAPGVQILSTWPNNSTKMLTGTSMATPHVTGIMAVYLSLADFTPSELNERIIKDAENTIKPQWYIPFISKKKPFASLKQLYDRLKQYELESTL